VSQPLSTLVCGSEGEVLGITGEGWGVSGTVCTLGCALKQEEFVVEGIDGCGGLVELEFEQRVLGFQLLELALKPLGLYLEKLLLVDWVRRVAAVGVVGL
jgi:hypothetical protein